MPTQRPRSSHTRTRFAAGLASLALSHPVYAAESFIRAEEVERLPPSVVTAALLGAVGDRTVEVAWDELPTGDGRETVLLIGRPQGAGQSGACIVPVTEVTVSSDQVRPPREHPVDALYVRALQTTLRYLIIGPLDDGDAPDDGAPCKAVKSAANAFASTLDGREVWRAALTFQNVLSSARAGAQPSKLRCEDTQQPGACSAPALRTLASLRLADIKRLDADPENDEGRYAAVVNDGRGGPWWRVTFGAPTDEVVIAPYLEIILTSSP